MLPDQRVKHVSEVLLVDDNTGDTELISELLQGSDRAAHTHSVIDGVEAMAFLRCEGKYSCAPRPHLILLDLNMPRRNGWSVLADAKSDVALKNIPIVVFTTSEAMLDIGRCYELGANCYVSKPGAPDVYTATVITIGKYWLGIASLEHQEER
jgi:chemotaxis family two-component system response regulator Rcp1